MQAIVATICVIESGMTFSPPGDDGVSIVADEEQPKIVRVLRQGVLVICPQCGSRCFANRSEERFTRYYCSGGECNYSTKVAKPKIDG